MNMAKRHLCGYLSDPGIYFCFQKKYWPLVPLALSYPNLHMFVLLIAAVFIGS